MKGNRRGLTDISTCICERARAGSGVRRVLGAALALGAAVLPGAAADTFVTPSLELELDPASQTALALSPAEMPDFSFVPGEAARDGHYRLGDLDLRVRVEGEEDWHDFSTAFRRASLAGLDASGPVLAGADLTRSFGEGFPLSVTREWLDVDGELVMRFTLENPTGGAVEIGGLGMALVFDNNLGGRSLDEAHTRNVFYDPYVGLDAGYLQVTRLNGDGPALLVLPERGTPFEEYKPIAAADWSGEGDDAHCIPEVLHDCTPHGITFEGHYDWMVHSAGFQDEWADEGSWNTPSRIVLQPGERHQVGLRFITAPQIRDIETTLREAGHPVAVGLPGYVLPEGQPADLFLSSRSDVESLTVAPEGALDVEADGQAAAWARYRVTGRRWGRSRLTVRYADGRRQTIHYFVTKPSDEVVDDLGEFLFTRQWFDVPDDPFDRAPSIMSYDRDEDAIVTQDNRVWIAGLSDEGGAGSWVAAISKQLIDPDPEEIRLFERFYTETLEGRLQYVAGPMEDGVVKSLFWYDPEEAPDFTYDPELDWDSWSAWDREHAGSTVRSFNYVHVALAQWTLYRLARNYDDLVHSNDWRWYLDRAYRTSIAMVRQAPEYVMFGQMEGDVFVEILTDLRREGMTQRANALEAAMRARAGHWHSLAYPFGSEMPWDSTGQAEVHAWLRHFGHDAQADATREVILAYDPLIPHWGYNGSARRYWDFLFAGKVRRIERQLHHYGSALNAVPLFADYRRDPSDFHLLRVAYGGLMGATTNIDQDGFGSAAFHSMPDMRRFDGYSGDYGMGFFGHAFSTASYLVMHDTFGWLGFGGTVESRGSTVSIRPADTGRRRVFVQPVGLWLTLDAGRFERVRYDMATGDVEIEFVAEGAFSPAARLRVQATADDGQGYSPAERAARERGAWVVPFENGTARLTLRPETP